MIFNASSWLIYEPVFVFDTDFYSFVYSKISAGWQSSAWQMASRVLNLIALALPVFKIERLEGVKSTFSDSSFNDIFRLAIITSKFTIIGMVLYS
jgi:hypothetical protein